MCKEGGTVASGHFHMTMTLETRSKADEAEMDPKEVMYKPYEHRFMK